MSLAVDSSCLECHLRRSLQTARALGDEATATAFAKELMRLYLSAPEGVSSSWYGPAVSDLLERYYNLEPNRFREEKRFSNEFVLQRLDTLNEQIASAPDPVKRALQLAILGNYLDFAALQGQVDFRRLETMLAEAGQMPLDEDCYSRLLQDLQQAERLLYLTDNAGEIVFDRLLAETLRRQFPQLQITFCVRGGYIHNDATREDAEAIGLTFPVIDNGNRVGGTELSLLGEEAKQAFARADVIFAKGMGNTETLLGCGYNVYYAFLVKCARLAGHFGKPLMTPMLVSEQAK